MPNPLPRDDAEPAGRALLLLLLLLSRRPAPRGPPGPALFDGQGHFVFNSLNSIQKYILRNEGEVAQAYLAKFGAPIRLGVQDLAEGTRVVLRLPLRES